MIVPMSVFKEFNCTRNDTYINDVLFKSGFLSKIIYIKEIKQNGIQIDVPSSRPDCKSILGILRELAPILSLPANYFLKVDMNHENSIIIDNQTGDSFSYAVCIGTANDELFQFVEQSFTKDILIANSLYSNNVLQNISMFTMLFYGLPLLIIPNICATLCIKKLSHLKIINGKSYEKGSILIDNGSTSYLWGEQSEIDYKVANSYYFIILSVEPASMKNILDNNKIIRDKQYFALIRSSINNDFVQSIICLSKIINGIYSCCVVENECLKSYSLSINEIRKYIGADVSYTQILESLTAYRYNVCEASDKTFIIVETPSFRIDIKNKTDIIADIFRYVYAHLDLNVLESQFYVCKNYFIYETKLQLSTMGFKELINYPFLTKSDLSIYDKVINNLYECTALQIFNPIQKEKRFFSSSLLPNIYKYVLESKMKVFEAGKVKYMVNGRIIENSALCIAESQVTSFELILNMSNRIFNFWYQPGYSFITKYHDKNICVWYVYFHNDFIGLFYFKKEIDKPTFQILALEINLDKINYNKFQYDVLDNINIIKKKISFDANIKTSIFQALKIIKEEDNNDFLRDVWVCSTSIIKDNDSGWIINYVVELSFSKNEDKYIGQMLTRFYNKLKEEQKDI